MAIHNNAIFPDAVEYGYAGGPAFKTTANTEFAGNEQRFRMDRQCRAHVEGEALSRAGRVGVGLPAQRRRAWTAPLDPPGCLALVGTVSGSFNIPYGQSRAGSMTLALDGNSVPFSSCSAFINANASPPTLGIIGSSSITYLLVSSLHPALFVPGTLPLGGAVVPIIELGPALSFRTLMVNGSITFRQASSTIGQPVVGTFGGDVAAFWRDPSPREIQERACTSPIWRRPASDD